MRTAGSVAPLVVASTSLSAGAEEQAVKDDIARKHITITSKIEPGLLKRDVNMMPPPINGSALVPV